MFKTDLITKRDMSRAQIWKRDDAIVLAAATSFGLTETQIDEFFISGAKL